MRLLLTGASGTIGARLVRIFADRGFRVRALVLPDDPFAARLEGIEQLELERGDITRPETLRGLFDDVHSVFHLAAVILTPNPQVFDTVNVEGTRNVVDGAARAGVSHFVFCSSASVVYPHTTAYSRSKRECERIVREQREMAFTIVRPTLVYESGGGQEFVLFDEYLRRFPVVPFVGSGAALKNPVHVDDLIEGIAAIAGSEAACGKTYNLCGGEEVTIRELAELMLAHAGLQKPIISIPVPLCRLAARVMGVVLDDPPLTLQAIAGITQHANLDCSEATRDLGYQPVGVRAGLARCERR